MVEPGSIAAARAARALAALAFVLVLSLPLRAAAQSAPAAPGAALFPLSTLWTVTLDTAPALAAAYDEQHAYFVLKPDPDRGLTSARLTAISLGDGSTGWTRDIAAADALAAGDDQVFTCTGGLLQAHAAADGTPRWQLALDAPLSAPMHVVAGWLIAVTQASDVVAVRTRDGSKLWQAHLPSPATGEPSVNGNQLYLPLTDNRVLQLHLETGAIVWDRKIVSQPMTIVALDDRVFVGTRQRWFYALQPKDGKVLWRFSIGGAVVGAPAVDRSAVYFLALDNLLRALGRGRGSLRWRTILVRRDRFGPFRASNLLFVSGSSKTIQAYDAGTGKPAGSFDAPGDLNGPIHFVPGIIAVDFLIVAVTGEGQIVAIRPQSLQPEAFTWSPRMYLITGFPIWRW